MGHQAGIIELLESDLERYDGSQCDPYIRGRMALALAEALWSVRGAETRALVLERVDSALPHIDEPSRGAAWMFRAEVES
ncbi:MAG: hypothetical protein AAF799_48020 [Myxococcota bacterium]